MKAEDSISQLVDQKVKALLEIQPESEDFKPEVFEAKLKQAKIGMTYIRDREIMARIQQGQVIRIIGFISSDTMERKQYIDLSMPHLLPAPKENRKVG